jgi:uncharacterized protein (DUF1499 family)
MKKMIYLTMLGIFLALCLIFIILSFVSRRPPVMGLVNGRLRPCPGTPNCVCSETPESPFFVDPLKVKGSSREAWERAKGLVQSLGGRIEFEEEEYLQAVFVTKLFRFRDDVELRMDTEKGLIHIRSSSRVGNSDFGQNRKRVMKFQAAFMEGFREDGPAK